MESDPGAYAALSFGGTSGMTGNAFMLVGYHDGTSGAVSAHKSSSRSVPPATTELTVRRPPPRPPDLLPRRPPRAHPCARPRRPPPAPPATPPGPAARAGLGRQCLE